MKNEAQGAGEMDSVCKLTPCNYEDLSSDPQPWCKEADMAEQVHNPSSGGT